MVWCLNKGQNRLNEQNKSPGAVKGDRGCMKEDDSRREYRGTEGQRRSE